MNHFKNFMSAVFLLIFGIENLHAANWVIAVSEEDKEIFSPPSVQLIYNEFFM